MTQNLDEERPEEKTGLVQQTLKFLKGHFWLSLFSFIMMVTGVVYARIYFPELPLYKGVLGGMMFGLFCTMCGIGYKLFEIE
jgi:hypothetical protein